jgi:hypothetical protein
MTAATRAARSASINARREGEIVTYHGAAFGDVVCDMVIERDLASLIPGDVVSVDERRFEGSVAVSSLPADAARGDRVTDASGRVFSVQMPPHDVDGMWALTLRLESVG